MKHVRWRSVARVVVITLLCWGTVFAVFTIRDWIRLRSGVGARYFSSRTPTEIAVGWAPYCLLWAVVTPFAVYVAHRLPLTRPRTVRNFVLLVLATILLGHLRIAVGMMNWSRTDPMPITMERVRQRLLVASFGETTYAMMVMAVLVVRVTYRRGVADSRAAAELEAKLARAELQTLRLQLQPHFLFNTLNVISELVVKDPERAEMAIADLGDLLRRSLDGGGESQLVPLGREIEFLERYLALQGLRFGQRLRATISVAPGVAGVLVPSMILQPLVENAIHHSIARREGGAVAVTAEAHGAREILLRVTDDGAGFATAPREGIGLSNTRARLSQLFGDRQEVRFLSEESRFAVEIRLPRVEQEPRDLHTNA